MKSFSLPHWLSALSHFWSFRGNSRTSRPFSLRKVSLTIEHLEGRLTPSTFTVVNADASGPGSLASAVTQADADRSSSAVIIFAPSLSGTTIIPASTLSLNNPVEPVEIDAPAGGVTISGGNRFVPFVVSGPSVTLNGLSITQGHGQIGGAIVNFGNLSLERCNFSYNVATDSGGAIMNWDPGSLSVYACRFWENRATSCGGAIYNLSNMWVGSSSFNDNGANYGGAICSHSSAVSSVTLGLFSGNVSEYGGALANYGNLQIFTSDISGNRTYTADLPTTGYGGGAYNEGWMTIDSTTLQGNTATYGGALANAGTLTITSNNRASQFLSNDSTSAGGAIYTRGTLSVSGAQFSSNQANGSGGAIYSERYSTVTITSSTLTNNASYGYGGAINSYGTLWCYTSWITGNYGAQGGGGIEGLWGSVHYPNDVISSNRSRWGQDNVDLLVGI